MYVYTYVHIYVYGRMQVLDHQQYRSLGTSLDFRRGRQAQPEVWEKKSRCRRDHPDSKMMMGLGLGNT